MRQINALPQAGFVGLIGPLFEHSPWIAEATWVKRPFATVAALHRALCDTVLAAGKEKQLALIRAHPDLAGRAAKAGTLTRASAQEQAGGGLDRLTPEEAALFDDYNQRYHAKFGFPFVICVRQNKKEAMLAGFERRLKNTADQERETALAEVFKIAELRLNDLI